MQPFFTKYQALILIVLLGIFLRFYNLNWGAPFYFHPDERNIASSVSQLEFPDQMNPHFFAYGSFPVYVIYFTGVIHNALLYNVESQINYPQTGGIMRVSFEHAIVISRIYSIFLSVILLLLLYKMGIVLKGKSAGLLALFLSATSVGFIQYAHFGTFEIWLSFFSVLLCYFLIRYLNTSKQRFFLYSSITLGLLNSIKISSVVLFVTPLFTLALLFYHQYRNTRLTHKKNELVVGLLLNILVLLIATFLIFFFTNPYVFLDSHSFRSSMQYESSVALGTLPVFYTGEFYDTTPILFQFTKIYPFLVNPVVTLLVIPSIAYITYQAVKKRNSSYFMLLSFYFLLFLSQAFLFAKWTRYMIPTLPFLYLMISVFLTDFWKDKNRTQTRTVISSIFLVSLLFTLSYFITVHLERDTRVQAAEFAKEHIPHSAKIVSEVYDLGIVPFNPYFHNITLFNFYDLDPVESYRSPSSTNRTWLTERFDGASPNTKLNELNNMLIKTDYIILPSQRILKPRLLHLQQFPEGNKFYNDLLSKRLGFKKIYQTPCDIFCKIAYMSNPVFNVEETVNVFDRPTVFIFKKVK